MATETLPPTVPTKTEQRIRLHDVGWGTYRNLLAALTDRPSPRLTFLDGTLEIMSPSRKHEKLARFLCALVQEFARDRGIDIDDGGVTTLEREDLARGAEPDGSFYVKNEPAVRGKDAINLSVDPPPDLIVEVDITSGSLDKFSIYRQFGIPEIWHYSDDTGFSIRHLGESGYVVHSNSLSFPRVTAENVRAAIREFQANGRSAGLDLFRALQSP